MEKQSDRLFAIRRFRDRIGDAMNFRRTEDWIAGLWGFILLVAAIAIAMFAESYGY